MSASRASLLAAILSLSCGPEPTAPRDPDAGAPAATTPFDDHPVSGRIRRIDNRAEVPLSGHRIDARHGDWLLESDTSVAVVSADEGRVIAFGKRDGVNGLVYLHPTAYEAFDAMPIFEPRIEVVRSSILHVTARVKTKPLVLHVWLTLQEDALTVASEVENIGDERELAITLGERAAWANTPTWLAGYGELLSGGSYGGEFIGRDGPGVAYALCNHDGRMNVKSTSPSAPGFHRTHKTGRDRVSIAAGDKSPVRRVTLTHAPASVGAAALKLPCALDREHIDMPSAATGYGIEVAHCESEAAHAARLLREDDLDDDEEQRGTSTPYVRYAPTDRIAVPTVCARIRLTRRGHAPGAWIDPRRDDERGFEHEELIPRAGALRWRIREKAAGDDAARPALPAKLIVRGTGETKTPSWGEDPRDGAARHFIYTVEDGEIAIPPGTYEVSVYRGFEYTRAVKKVTVEADGSATIEAELERVVDTRGWVSADLHVHAMPSWDAPANLGERVRSLAAVGVEVAVATDHDAVTDYAPAIAALGMSDHLASVVGDEITTEKTMLGHFNVFPLESGSEPIADEHVHPHDLFAKARRRADGGVIQVNHPRMGSIGYFELLHLDRGDVSGWAARATLGDMSFDAIEVFNGDHYDDIEEVRWVLDDWFALLGAGMRHTATGNSDSHKVAYQDAGMPRNWVALDEDAPKAFDGDAFVKSIRGARVVVSSGPFIRFRAGDQDIGGTLDPGTHPVSIRVDAAPWIPVDEVQLIRSGHVIESWKVKGGDVKRLDEKVDVALASGDWLVVIASSRSSIPNAYRSKAKPFAFTNPIWVRR